MPDLAAALSSFTGNQLPLAPHVSGVHAGARVPDSLGEGALNLEGNANYKSHVFFDVYNDPYIQQDAYWIGNLRASYEFTEAPGDRRVRQQRGQQAVLFRQVRSHQHLRIHPGYRGDAAHRRG